MQFTSLTLDPIGFFKAEEKDKSFLPRQAGYGKKNQGRIILNPFCNYEQALADVKGFDRIWVLFWFHENKGWKPKVQTPYGPPKRGVFATRSPHRPNPIGLSCLTVVDVQGREVLVGDHDLLDGTPILDIKPYIAYADAWPDAARGWLDDVKKGEYQVVWSEKALKQKSYLEEVGVLIEENVDWKISQMPFPTSNNRIHFLENGMYELAYKTWRLKFFVDEEKCLVEILKIASGYDLETLEGKKISRWDDVEIHQKFNERFKNKL